MILAVSKRWHLWRHRFARWMLEHVVMPAARRLAAIAQESSTTANELNDKARMRLEVCQRCPRRNPTLDTCRACGCWLPAKVQIRGESCPEGRW